MELSDLIKALKERPGIYVGKKEYFTLHDYGMFIDGFLTAREGKFENFFLRRFPVFVRNMLGVEPSGFEFWFETIYGNCSNEEEAQEMFFDYFDRFRIIYSLVPKDKFDTSGGEYLMKLEDKELDVIAPLLLEWIQDINWPVANYMIKVLAAHQDVTEKYIRRILSSDQPDDEWKTNTIRFLLPAFTHDFNEELTLGMIERIAAKPTDGEHREEADEAAREYLERIPGANDLRF